MDKGKPGRPKKDRAATVAITTKLPLDEAAELEAFIEAKNARLAEDGFGAEVTVSGFVRSLITQALRLAQAPSVRPAEPANGTSVGHPVGVDERTVRPPLHGKRVRPPAERPVVESAPEPPEGGPPDDLDLEGLLGKNSPV